MTPGGLIGEVIAVQTGIGDASGISCPILRGRAGHFLKSKVSWRRQATMRVQVQAKVKIEIMTLPHGRCKQRRLKLYVRLRFSCSSFSPLFLTQIERGSVWELCTVGEKSGRKEREGKETK